MKNGILIGKLLLQNYVDQLKQADPQFAREWDSIEERNGGASLLDELVPADYFPLGGP